MTRETKVGLVVAGSFLCLVGIVLASKLQEGNSAQAESPPAHAARRTPAAALPNRSSGPKAPSRSTPRDARGDAGAAPGPRSERRIPAQTVPGRKHSPDGSGGPIILASGEKEEARPKKPRDQGSASAAEGAAKKPLREKSKESETGEKVPPPLPANLVPPPPSSGNQGPEATGGPLPPLEKKEGQPATEKPEPADRPEGAGVTAEKDKADEKKEKELSDEEKNALLARMAAEREKKTADPRDEKKAAGPVEKDPEKKDHEPVRARDRHPKDEPNREKKDSVPAAPLPAKDGEPGPPVAPVVKTEEAAPAPQAEKTTAAPRETGTEPKPVEPLPGPPPAREGIAPAREVEPVPAAAVKGEPLPATGEKKEPAPVLHSNHPENTLPKSVAVPPLPPAAEEDRASAGKGEVIKNPLKAPAPSGGPAPFPLPPLGGATGADSPPIAVPRLPAAANGGGSRIVPRVDSFVVETYRAGPSDTFASISNHYYRSDRYERALLQFNRDHHLATAAVLRDPPVLTGENVYVPPRDVLENRYGQLIPGHLAARVAGPPVVASAPKVAPPAETPVIPVSAWATPTKTRPYRVQGQGERLYDVARHTLGNPNRWAEIYRLNPQLAPENVVPAGTLLQLPPDARVAQEATP
jgi:hypothetical protein